MDLGSGFEDFVWLFRPYAAGAGVMSLSGKVVKGIAQSDVECKV